VGTGICLVPQRHPLIMAKQVATLDFISGGRFEFGVGAGWMLDEMKLFGADTAHPWANAKDFILAMKKLWTEDTASYSGKYVKFPAVHCDPKPVQKPHPPVLIAGEGPKAAERVASYGDGWFPRGRNMTGKALEEGIKKVNGAWKAKGRTGKPTISVFGAPADKAKVNEFFAAGADRVIVGLPCEDEPKIVERLKKIAGDLF
jgi:probable F420-dependent oxidoreductase